MDFACNSINIPFSNLWTNSSKVCSVWSPLIPKYKNLAKSKSKSLGQCPSIAYWGLFFLTYSINLQISKELSTITFL